MNRLQQCVVVEIVLKLKLQLIFYKSCLSSSSYSIYVIILDGLYLMSNYFLLQSNLVTVNTTTVV